jgi:integrase
MDSKRTKRAAAVQAEVGFRVPGEDEVWRGAEQWQSDWRSEAPEPEAEPKRKPTAARRPAAAATAAAAAAPAAATVPATQRDVQDELRRWMQSNRNQNTAATYASAWRQFERWATEVANPTREMAARVDLQRPSEMDVALYMRYIVQVKGGTMQSVGAALAGIADHTRYSGHYPARGEIITQMRLVLTPLATPAGQKKEISWELLARAATAAETTQTALGRRDAALMLLAYFCYLRGSEVARMRRGDVTIAPATDATKGRVLHVYVHPLCKNDTDRKGHTRLVQERPAGQICVLRAIETLLAEQGGRGAEEPLFPLDGGGSRQMRPDTPRGRLKHWMRQSGVADVAAYGFHSLRAGAATASAKAGVSERDIKQHGNWASDAVRAYIRPDEEERLRASNALGAR